MTFIGFKTVLASEVSTTNPNIGDLFLTDSGTFDGITNDTAGDRKRAAAQGIQSRLQLVKGEYFLNLLEGIPYFTHILVKNPSFPLIRSLISNTVSTYPGVVRIPQLELSLNKNTRELSITLSVEIDNGLIITSEDFGDIILDVNLPRRTTTTAT